LAVNQDVLVALDELAGGEVEDVGLVQLRIEGKVEAFERLSGIEVSAAQPQTELALPAPLDLVMEQERNSIYEACCSTL